MFLLFRLVVFSGSSCFFSGRIWGYPVFSRSFSVVTRTMPQRRANWRDAKRKCLRWWSDLHRPPLCEYESAKTLFLHSISWCCISCCIILYLVKYHLHRFLWYYTIYPISLNSMLSRTSMFQSHPDIFVKSHPFKSYTKTPPTLQDIVDGKYPASFKIRCPQMLVFSSLSSPFGAPQVVSRIFFHQTVWILVYVWSRYTVGQNPQELRWWIRFSCFFFGWVSVLNYGHFVI